MKQRKNKTFTSNHYQIILDKVQLSQCFLKLKRASVFAFGIKTDDTSSISANLKGLSFATEPGIAIYIPILRDSQDVSDASEQLSCMDVLELLKPLLENEKLLKIGQNLKYDYSVLKKYNIELRGIAFDVALESYVLDSIVNCRNINSLSKHWLGRDPIFFKKTISKDRNQTEIRQTEFSKVDCHDAAEEIDVTLQLHLKIWPEIQKHKGFLNVFKNIEMPLLPVLCRIENNGVKIDSKILQKYSEEISLRLTKLKKEAHDIAGETFNLSSIKELKTILFEKQSIKSLKKTPGGAKSTSEEVLKKLALGYSLPKVILEYRKLAKLKSTYVDKLPLMVNSKTKRIHTFYHQTTTSTGRLSSTNPNLQNIPVRNEEGRRIRKAFVAPENYYIISADYSQIELRVLAHLSHDKGLITAFTEGKDIHCITAAEVFNLPLESITIMQRRSAKAINFGLIYGMNAFGLSRQLNISYKESQRYIDLYFERYSDVLKYIKNTRIQAKEKGYVETLDGRRLYLNDINSTHNARRSSAERTAINAPIQGTAADIIKRAMIAIDKWIEKEQPKAKMIMQVHDELVFEVYKENIMMVSKKIREIMENSMRLDVPLLVKIGIGENWDRTY